MKLTQEEITAILTDVTKTNPTNSQDVGSEAHAFSEAMLENEYFRRIVIMAVKVQLKQQDKKLTDVPITELNRLMEDGFMTARGATELGYWLGLAEAEKRRTGEEQFYVKRQDTVVREKSA